jgi:hypothetical protein
VAEKSTWRMVKNSRLGDTFRRTRFLSSLRSEGKGVEVLASQIGVSVLSGHHDIGLGVATAGKYFFVLGNGASVNDLSLANLETIRKGISVGINAWPLHRLIPNYFAFEFGRHSMQPDSDLSYLVHAAESKLHNASPSRLLFLRPGKPASVKAWVRLTSKGMQGSVMYGRANVFAQTKRALTQDLTRILQLIAAGKMAPTVLPDNGSSVVRMVFLGLTLGFKDITLIGVDLNGSSYFWEESRFIPDPQVPFHEIRRSPGDSISTQSTEQRPFSVSDFLAALAPLAETILGARISCANPRSRLAEHLPLFDFSSTRHRG